MFEGSKNVKEGEFDTLLEAAGGSNNGSTTTDRTNYYERRAVERARPRAVPRIRSHGLPARRRHAEARRRPARRRQERAAAELRERAVRHGQRPHDRADVSEEPSVPLAGHRLHGRPDGGDARGRARVLQEVLRAGNASLVIAGDINPAEARKKVEHWFARREGRRSRSSRSTCRRSSSPASIKETLTDRVQLPRLYLVVAHAGALSRPATPSSMSSPACSTGGKNSRLYKRLVYDLQLAQNVSACQASAQLRLAVHDHGHGAAVGGSAGEGARAASRRSSTRSSKSCGTRRRTRARCDRAKNGIESTFSARWKSSAAKADQLNAYYFATGNPDYFAEGPGAVSGAAAERHSGRGAALAAGRTSGSS